MDADFTTVINTWKKHIDISNLRCFVIQTGFTASEIKIIAEGMVAEKISLLNTIFKLDKK